MTNNMTNRAWLSGIALARLRTAVARSSAINSFSHAVSGTQSSATNTYQTLPQNVVLSTSSNDEGGDLGEIECRLDSTRHRGTNSCLSFHRNTLPRSAFSNLTRTGVVASRHDYSAHIERPATALAEINHPVALQSQSSTNDPSSIRERLKVFAIRENLNGLQTFYEELKEQQISMPVEVFNTMLSSLAQLVEKNTQVTNEVLISVYQDMLERQVMPNAETYSLIIKSLCRRADWVRSCLSTWEQKKNRHGCLNNHIVEKIQKIKAEENLTTALTIFNTSMSVHRQPYDLEIYNTLLQCLSREGMTDDMLTIYETLETSKIIPNHDTFRYLIRGFGLREDLRSALECYNEYKKLRTKLPPHDEFDMYKALITAYFDARKPDGAIQFFEKIKYLHGRKRASALHHSMIQGYCKMGDLEIAENWIQKIKDDASTGKITWALVGPVVQLAIDTGNIEMARKWWYYCESLTPNKTPFVQLRLAMVMALSNHGYVMEAYEQIEQYLKKSTEIDFDLVEHLCSKLIETGQDTKAATFFMKAVKTSHVNDQTLLKSAVRDIFERLAATWADKELDWKEICEPLLNTAFATGTMPFVNVERSSFARVVMTSFWNAYDEQIIDIHPSIISSKMANVLLQYQARTVIDVRGEEERTNQHLYMLIDKWAHVFRLQLIWASDLVEQALSLTPEKETYIDKWNEEVSPSLQLGFRGLPTSSTSTSSPGIDLTDFVEKSEKDVPRIYQQIPPFFQHQGDVRPHNHIASMQIIDVVQCAHQNLDLLMYPFQQVVRACQSLTPDSAARAIDYVGRAKRFDLADEIYQYCEKTIKPLPGCDFSHTMGWIWILNSMIIAHAYAGQYTEARNIHNTLLDMGIAPNANAFAAYVYNLNANAGREAMGYLNEAKSLGVLLNAFVYNTVIAKLTNAKEMSVSFDLFKEMKEKSIQPTAVTYGTLISACCRADMEQVAVELFEEMEKSPNFVPRVSSFNMMIQYYLHVKEDREQAKFYYDKMKQHNIMPSEHTLKLLSEGDIAI